MSRSGIRNASFAIALAVFAQAGFAGVLASSGCNGPTLPLPPPATPMLIVDAASGTVTLRGGPGNVAPRALVIVYNEDLERGVVVMATEQGEWEATVEAVVGHSLTVWQELGVDRGAALFLEVR